MSAERDRGVDVALISAGGIGLADVILLLARGNEVTSVLGKGGKAAVMAFESSAALFFGLTMAIASCDLVDKVSNDLCDSVAEGMNKGMRETSLNCSANDY